MVDKVKKKNADIVAGGRNKKKVAKKKTGRTIAKRKTPTTVAKRKTGNLANRKTGTVTTKPKKKPTLADTSIAKAKKKPSTLKRLGNVAKRVVRSPVGKFGPLGAAVTGAYFLGEEFFPNKKKKPVAKKPKPKKKAPIKKRKLSPGESKIRKSDIMGGSKGRLSGPKGPLGGKLDKRKKSTVVKKRNKRFDPRKANRAGSRFGQR